MHLEMSPVSPSMWLASRFTVSLKTSFLGISSEHSTNTTWGAYRPAAEALAAELANDGPVK